MESETFDSKNRELQSVAQGLSSDAAAVVLVQR